MRNIFRLRSHRNLQFRLESIDFARSNRNAFSHVSLGEPTVSEYALGLKVEHGEQRSEDKKLEHRSALTPNTVHKLIENGFAVNVERSPVRIFDDEEFERVGATLVQTGSWPDAPANHIIIGLKELPEQDFPLKVIICSLSQATVCCTVTLTW